MSEIRCRECGSDNMVYRAVVAQYTNKISMGEDGIVRVDSFNYDVEEFDGVDDPEVVFCSSCGCVHDMQLNMLY